MIHVSLAGPADNGQAPWQSQQQTQQQQVQQSPQQQQQGPQQQQQWQKPYDNSYGKPYQKPYDGGYQKPYNGGYQKPFDSGYSKPYQKPYNESYQKPFSGNYQKPYDGGYQKPYNGGYQKPYTGGYQKPWDGKPYADNSGAGNPGGNYPPPPSGNSSGPMAPDGAADSRLSAPSRGGGPTQSQDSYQKPYSGSYSKPYGKPYGSGGYQYDSGYSGGSYGGDSSASYGGGSYGGGSYGGGSSYDSQSGYGSGGMGYGSSGGSYDSGYASYDNKSPYRGPRRGPMPYRPAPNKRLAMPSRGGYDYPNQGQDNSQQQQQYSKPNYGKPYQNDNAYQYNKPWGKYRTPDYQDYGSYNQYDSGYGSSYSTGYGSGSYDSSYGGYKTPRNFRRPPPMRLGYPARDDEGPANPSAEQRDPGFDRFIDMAQLDQAWEERNPERLTDLAMQIVEGERVLGRKHHGLKVEQVFQGALEVAVDRHDEATLKRIAKAAADLHLPKLGEAVKHAEHSRNDARPAESAEAFKDTLRRVREARLANDRQGLEAIGKSLGNSKDLNPEQRAHVGEEIEQAMKKLAGEGHKASK
ncbi:MAG: hypothetical protein WCF18_19355 [Chthoniobacteraceae bacterium]